MPVFDGVNLTVTLDAPTAGVLNVDVQEDLYEPWKVWMTESQENRRYPLLFRGVAGDPLVDPLNIAPYFFVQNQANFGWRITTTDEDQEVNYIGNIVPEDADLPIFSATAGRTVMHLGLQPVTQGIRALQAQFVLQQDLLEADHVFDQANGLLHTYRRGTTFDLIPPKDVVTVITQDTSVTEPP